jgi:hypothetical protein
MQIDFSALMADASAGYLARPRLEAAVTSSTRGLVVVLGLAGSGKTSLAATLIGREGHLHHFLRRGHTEQGLWTDPYAFLTSVGFQLRERFGEELFPSLVGIDVSGRIERIEEGGHFTSARIKRLLTVPWRRVDIRSRVEVGHADGVVEGVVIQELVDEYRNIPLASYRNMALIEPLTRLHEQRPEEHVVLWVDGLDGDRSAQDTVASVLPALDELRAIGNLTLIVSARPGPDIQRFIDSGAEIVDLGAGTFADENDAVVGEFIGRQLADPAVVAKIEVAGHTCAGVGQLVQERSQANFLYLQHFFRAVRDGERGVIGEVPPGLTAIYVQLLDGLAARVGDGFARFVKPVLATLAVAARPLTRAQIGAFTGLGQDSVSDALDHLLPYLAREWQPQLALGQRALRDTLVDEAHDARKWRVVPAAAHGMVAEQYLKCQREGWAKVDDYGYMFLTSHLAQAPEPTRARLLEVLDESWRRAQRRHHGTNANFMRDIERAFDVARMMTTPEAVARTVQLGLMWTVIDAADHELPTSAIEVMVRTGQVQRALDTIHPGLNELARASRLAELATGLARQGQAHGVLGREVLHQGLEALEQDPNGFVLAELLAAYPTTDDRAFDPLLGRARSIVQRVPVKWQLVRPLIELARLQAGLDPSQARELFSEVLRIALGTLRSSLELELHQLFVTWAAVDPQGALAALPDVPLGPVHHSVATVMVLVGVADASTATNILEQVERQLLPGIIDPHHLGHGLVALGRAHLARGDRDAVLACLARATAAKAEIGGDRDPERQLSNRLSQRTDLLIDIAAFSVDVDSSEAATALDEAWRNFAAHGRWASNDFLAQLVNAQLRHCADLVEAYVSAIEDADRRAEMTIAWASALAGSDGVRAHKLLEQGCLAAETPRFGGRRGDLYFRLAQVGVHLDRSRTRELVDDKLGPEERVAYRMSCVAELDTDEAIEWLRKTVSIWTLEVDNQNYVSDLPAGLQQLPRSLVEPLTHDMAGTVGPKRALLSAAIGAALERSESGTGQALLQAALEASTEAAGRLPIYLLHAFIAGMWWKVAPERAERLWLDALLSFEANPTFNQDPGHRHTWLMMMLHQLGLGNPAAALPYLIACDEPRSDGIKMIMPGPQTPAHTVAGMSTRDYALGQTLARALGESPLRQKLELMQPAAVRSVALCGVAQDSASVILPERLRLLDLAMASAREVEAPYLQALLLADVAAALVSLRLAEKARKVALEVGELVRHASLGLGTIPIAGYANAAGRSIRVLLDADRPNDALALLWDTRHLGNDGLYQVAGHLCPRLAASGFEALAALAQAEREASRLFG